MSPIPVTSATTVRRARKLELMSTFLSSPRPTPNSRQPIPTTSAKVADFDILITRPDGTGGAVIAELRAVCAHSSAGAPRPLGARSTFESLSRCEQRARAARAVIDRRRRAFSAGLRARGARARAHLHRAARACDRRQRRLRSRPRVTPQPRATGVAFGENPPDRPRAHALREPAHGHAALAPREAADARHVRVLRNDRPRSARLARHRQRTV